MKKQDTLILSDGITEVQTGENIQISCRSYRFIDDEVNGTSTQIMFGEDGIYKFLYKDEDHNGIIVAEPRVGGGTYFVYTGPDKVTKSGTHLRKPNITKPQAKKIKGVKRKKKLPEVVLPPSVVGSKQKDLAPLPKKRGRPAGSKNKKKKVKRK